MRCPKGVEGTHRPEVAVGLVLELAERALGVPQVGGPSQEVERRDREVELGVGDDQPRGLGQGQAVSNAQAATSPPQTRPLRAHRLRSTAPGST